MPSPATVTGNLQTISGGKITQGFVIFQLSNLGTGNPITITGTAIFPNLKVVCMSAADGSFSQSLWGNDNINPANTIYNVSFRDSAGVEVGPIQYSITGGAVNLNSLAALSTTTPPVLAVGTNIIVTVNLPPQSASIGSTPLYSVPSSGAGLYRVSMHLVTTTAGTAGTATPNITYNNGSAAKAIAGGTINLAILGDETEVTGTSAPAIIYVAASTVINYSVTNSGSTGLYQLRIRLEYLG